MMPSTVELSLRLTSKIDGEGNLIAVTKAGQVLAQHVCIPLHDGINARVATALSKRLYREMKSVYGVMLKC